MIFKNYQKVNRKVVNGGAKSPPAHRQG